jgi:O-acetyl-ADP-ribose deacetylase (regulator of RNase III)
MRRTLPYWGVAESTVPSIELPAHNYLSTVPSLGGCATGRAKITSGFSLKARFVIHAVGPIWQGGNAGESELLASCYRASMELAAERNLTTLAFPAISCGVFGYPVSEAAHVAMVEVLNGLQRFAGIESVWLVCFGGDVLAAYQAAYTRLIH